MTKEMEMPGFQLFTARYSNMRDGFGVAVRTSIGEPKFPYDASRRDEVKELMPYGLFGEEDKQLFMNGYLRRLENAGVEKLTRRFVEIAKRHDCPQLVLLCYEDVSKSWCHRTMFAQWWEIETKQEVIELEPQATLL